MDFKEKSTPEISEAAWAAWLQKNRDQDQASARRRSQMLRVLLVVATLTMAGFLMLQ